MGCVDAKPKTHVIDKSKLKLDTRPPINSAKSQLETSKQPQSQPNTPLLSINIQRKSTVNQPPSPLPFYMEDDSPTKLPQGSGNARRLDTNGNSIAYYIPQGKPEIVLVDSLDHCNPQIVGFDWSKAVNEEDPLAQPIAIPDINIVIK